MRTLEFEKAGDGVIAMVTTTSGVPRPTGSDVLVEVAASSINGSDLGLRRSSGLMAMATSRSRPGFDVAGHVVGCGEKVTAFEIGDAVMGLLDHGGGGQADYVIVTQRRLAYVPATMSLVDAATIPLAGLTALQALSARGRLQAGTATRVLINGAAGGIGSFAVQLAKLFGAHVTAVTSGDRHDYLTSLGADETVDRGDTTLLSGSSTFDVIFDTPGSLRLADARSALDAKGVLVTTHPITSDTIRMIRPPWQRARGPRVAAVTTAAASEDLSLLARLVQEGRVRVPLDKTYPLAEAETAYIHAESGHIRGKTVLTL